MKIFLVTSTEALFPATMECDVVSPTEDEMKSNYEIVRGSGVTRCKVHSHIRSEGVTRVPEGQRSKCSHGKFLVTNNSSVEGRTLMWKTSSSQQPPQPKGRLRISGRRLLLPGR